MLSALPIVHKGNPGTASYYNIEAAREEGEVSSSHDDTSTHVGALMFGALLLIVGFHFARFEFASEVKVGTK